MFFTVYRFLNLNNKNVIIENTTMNPDVIHQSNPSSGPIAFILNNPDPIISSINKSGKTIMDKFSYNCDFLEFYIHPRILFVVIPPHKVFTFKH